MGNHSVARRERLLRSLAAELSPLAPSSAICVDFVEPGAAGQAAHEILASHGPVSALVNNAGFGIDEPFLDHQLVDHYQLMQVNDFAPLELTRVLLPAMVSRGAGAIVNVSSMSAKMGPWGQSGYAASKAALRAMTETLDAECAPHGVRLSRVFPGVVATLYFAHARMKALFPKVEGRAVAPERCARAICRLLRHPRTWKCVPAHDRLLDRVSACNARLAHAIVARSSH